MNTFTRTLGFIALAGSGAAMADPVDDYLLSNRFTSEPVEQSRIVSAGEQQRTLTPEERYLVSHKFMSNPATSFADQEQTEAIARAPYPEQVLETEDEYGLPTG